MLGEAPACVVVVAVVVAVVVVEVVVVVVEEELEEEEAVVVVVVVVVVGFLSVPDASWSASLPAATPLFILVVVLFPDERVSVVSLAPGLAVVEELGPLVALFEVSLAAAVIFSKRDVPTVPVDFGDVVAVVAAVLSVGSFVVDVADGDGDGEDVFNEVLFASRSTDLGSSVAVLAAS